MSSDNKVLNILLYIVNKVPILFLPIYYITYLIPRNSKIWVFGSSFGKSFTGNPKYFYLYANSKDDEIRPIWISKDKNIVLKLTKEGYESYNIYSLKGIWYSLIAKVYVFDHYSKDISFWCSGGAIKMNLWHGIPLKKGHHDNKFDRVRNPQKFSDKIKWTFRRIQNENPSHYYAVTSEFIKNLHTRAFKATKERVFVCGYSRNDIFCKNDYLENKESIIVNSNDFFDELKSKKDKNTKIIIYMPTFRESESEFFDTINMNKLNEFMMENNIIFLVKAHHLSKLTEKFEEISYSNIKNIKATDDSYPFLRISDLLITDYSSVYFDYLLMDKPMIFFPYDLETYMSESRELYYEYDSITPGPIVRNMVELMKNIKKSLNNDDKYNDKRKEVMEQMFDYYDGKSSERLYKEIKNLLK